MASSNSSSTSWLGRTISFLPFAGSSNKNDNAESSPVGPQLEKATEEAEVKHPGDLSPFLDAQKIATDHFLRLNRQIKRSQVLNYVQGVAAIILAGGLVALALDSRTEMYETQVDMRSGEIVNVSKAKIIEGDPEVLKVRAVIRKFVRGIRLVYSDRRATRASLSEAYVHLLDGSKALAFLNDYYRRTGEYPLDEVGEVQRSVEKISLNKQGDSNTWSLRWIEREYGDESRKRVFEGSISLRDPLPQSEATAEQRKNNPYLIFVVGFHFNSVSEEFLSSSNP